MKEHRRCIVCEELKAKQDNFRVVNTLNGYTSKTCHACEQIAVPRTSEGYMYVLVDSAFPEYIKIGYTTNPENRVRDYNKARPLDTCMYVYVSALLDNILKIEKNILIGMSMFTRPTPGRKEWFPIEYKEKLIAKIKVAEENIDNYPRTDQE